MFNPALPAWLAGLTGASKFANNGAAPANLGDMMQAAGHSMLQHYRGKGGTFAGPGSSGAPMPQVMPPAPTAPSIAQVLPALGPQPGITGQPLPAVGAPPAPASGASFGEPFSGSTPGMPWGRLSGGGLPLAMLLGGMR